MEYVGYVIDALQTALLGYLAWRKRGADAAAAVEVLEEPVKVALKRGRERLRARLAEKAAK